MMKIVLLHYHLKPGGVTTVLHHQIKAIQSFGEVLVLTGEEPGFQMECSWICIPGIAYDAVRTNNHSAVKVAQDISKAIFDHWKEGCNLIHIHNPTLAKNSDFLSIIGALQSLRFRLFLQIHDFAEDGRPNAYYGKDYPQDCHYGVINRRDYDLLISSGIKKEGLHLLENAIEITAFDKSIDCKAEHVLYPVRAIRRKNIGEAILVSLFWSSKIPLRITLPPNNEHDYQSYSFWREFCSNHSINTEFEVGKTESLPLLMAKSLFVLSSSVSEGFGFSFLESWLYDKPMWGRYLPSICEGFEQSGLNLGHLYKKIDVPLKWIQFDNFKEEWQFTIDIVSKKYNYKAFEQSINSWLGAMERSGSIDFSYLSEMQQAQTIKNVISDDKARKELAERNPFLLSIKTSIPGIEEIDKNKKVILTKFGLSHYAKNLKYIYGSITGRSVIQSINRISLLKEFFRPDQFHLLKWGDFSGC